MLQSFRALPRARPCCHTRADAGPSRPYCPSISSLPRNQFSRQQPHAWVPKSHADDHHSSVTEQRPPAEASSHGDSESSSVPACNVRPRGEEVWSLASLGLRPNTHYSWLLSLSALAGITGLLGSGPPVDLAGTGTTAASIGVMALIVTVHEAGHFLAARAQGIRVSKFAIGFGPPIWTYTSKEGIEYSFRAFPLGGYVAFPEPEGEDAAPTPTPTSSTSTSSKTSVASKAATARKPTAAPLRPATSTSYDSNDPDLLENRPIWQRAIVIAAGVTANVIFALAVLFLQVTTVGKAETAFLPGVQVPLVTPGSPAQRAGLLRGDVILSIGGQAVPAAFSQVRDTVNVISVSAGKPLSVLVDRHGDRLELNVVPEASTSGGRGKIGAELASNVFINHIKAQRLDEGARMAWDEFHRLSSSVLKGLVSLVTNFAGMADQLSGPVAIVAAGSKLMRTDVAGLFQFCALVNINLAVVNVLPLPALDGGYLVLLMLEGLRNGKKLPTELQENVTAGSMLLLLMMGLGLVVRDTINLF